MSGSSYGWLHAFDDLALRYGTWQNRPGKTRGTILLLGGRSEFMEKYTSTIEDLVLRGFDVASFDWRGQGLSGRMQPDSRKCYVGSYRHYLWDLDLLIHEIVLHRCRRPLIFLAHSMGAHVVLRYLAEFPAVADKAVFTAPMIDIRLKPPADRIARSVSRWMVRVGRGRAGLPAILHADEFEGPFRSNRLTSDSARFYQIRRLAADNPRLTAPRITFGWLDATFESIDALQAAGYAENIATPVLFASAGRDRVVGGEAAARFGRRLPRCRMVTIEGALHEILQERENFRRRFWRAFDAFLQ